SRFPPIIPSSSPFTNGWRAVAICGTRDHGGIDGRTWSDHLAGNRLTNGRHSTLKRTGWLSEDRSNLAPMRVALWGRPCVILTSARIHNYGFSRRSDHLKTG